MTRIQSGPTSKPAVALPKGLSLWCVGLCCLTKYTSLPQPRVTYWQSWARPCIVWDSDQAISRDSNPETSTPHVLLVPVSD